MYIHTQTTNKNKIKLHTTKCKTFLFQVKCSLLNQYFEQKLTQVVKYYLNNLKVKKPDSIDFKYFRLK